MNCKWLTVKCERGRGNGGQLDAGKVLNIGRHAAIHPHAAAVAVAMKMNLLLRRNFADNLKTLQIRPHDNQRIPRLHDLGRLGRVEKLSVAANGQHKLR